MKGAGRMPPADPCFRVANVGAIITHNGSLSAAVAFFGRIVAVCYFFGGFMAAS